MAKEL